jgi:hypothetical protein
MTITKAIGFCTIEIITAVKSFKVQALGVVFTKLYV